MGFKVKEWIITALTLMMLTPNIHGGCFWEPMGTQIHRFLICSSVGPAHPWFHICRFSQSAKFNLQLVESEEAKPVNMEG